MKTEECPLSGDISLLFYRDDLKNTQYFKCPRCKAVFLSKENHLSSTDEKTRYSLHKNTPSDPAYRKFLNQLVQPLSKNIKTKSFGLDYGSGPGPTLGEMFEEAGHSMSNYDPFFAPNESALNKSYDFISCSETAEHFHTPKAEFSKLSKMLQPGGVLGLMTLLLQDEEDFATWHYRKDPTHVFFYNLETLMFIKNQYFDTLEVVSNRVAIFKK